MSSPSPDADADAVKTANIPPITRKRKAAEATEIQPNKRIASAAASETPAAPPTPVTTVADSHPEMDSEDEFMSMSSDDEIMQDSADESAGDGMFQGP